jgi:hypothetical protein
MLKEAMLMGKRQLLFVTYRDENIEDGVSYAIELAKAMFEDITLLLVRKKSKLIDKIGDLMTAASFAEEGEHETARQIMAGGSEDSRRRSDGLIVGIVERCRKEGIEVDVQDSDLDAVAGIRSFLKTHSGIDKVVLSPVVTEGGNVTAKELNRLVRTASRPIVTMTRQSVASLTQE